MTTRPRSSTTRASKPAGLGIVETKIFRLSGPYRLRSGGVLAEVEIAYETYGELDPEKNNAVLICHALSGDAHVAGFHPGDDKPGWWDRMIGPGKAFDTDKYFIVSSNVVGGCRGSTGPASTNPATGKPYGLTFPLVTVADMVDLQKRLVEHLGIEKLLAAAGGSMGGMQVLQWGAAHPDSVSALIPIATAARHSALQIAFNEVGRQAVMSDPDWREGDYYGRRAPARGLALARMVGHITYLSEERMEKKFGRHRHRKANGSGFTEEFAVEGYLRFKGDDFVRRFDANSYLYLTRAIDGFDLGAGRALVEAFRGLSRHRLLAIAFSSDWLYPPVQSKEIVRAAKLNGADVTYCEITSDYGHDAFLIEAAEQSRLISRFLEVTRTRAAEKSDEIASPLRTSDDKLS